MKIINYLNPILLTLLAFGLYSCENYHFSNPLPVDVRNIYVMPRQFRGTWVDNGDTIIIGKDFYKKTHIEITKVINGIWINPTDTLPVKTDSATLKKYTSLKKYESLQRILYDSAKHPTDTVNNYILKGNKIYKIAENNQLELGAYYYIKDDTIYYQYRKANDDEMELTLGKNSFLRKISTNSYLLNIKEGAEIKRDDWWSVYLLEIVNDDILVRPFSDAILHDKSKIYSKGSDHYFGSQWTRNDMIKLIDDSTFFDDAVIKIPIKDKLNQ